MTIGIIAVAAFRKEKTGVEWYVHNLIKGLTKIEDAKKHQFILYTRYFTDKNNKLEFHLPKNFKIKSLWWPLPILWTQIRLSLTMIFHRPDILLCPSHIAPFISPQKTIITIHGFEYEYCQKMYSFFRRLYLRWLTSYSFKKAWKIIVPSINTKNDLLKFLGESKKPIEVISHGIDVEKIKKIKEGKQPQIIEKKYILYIGRIEKRKNISGIIKIFKLLKERYAIPHKLILAGPFGYGYNFKKLQREIEDSEIDYLGYVSEERKYNLLKNADLFIFIPFYEGFGIPLIEARAFNIPIIFSDISSLSEIAGESSLKINYFNLNDQVEKIYEYLNKNKKSEDIIDFDWQKTAERSLTFAIK